MAYNLTIKEISENRDKYVSLAEGADYSGYSQDYLRFRIRQGKLRGAKIGRNWLTTTEWLDEYLQNVADYKETVNNPGKKAVAVEEKEPAISPELAQALEAVSEPILAPTNVTKATSSSEEELEQKVAVDLRPSSVRTFEPAKAPMVWDLGWLKYALGLVCCFGVFGFVLGLAYPYLQPAAQNIQGFIEERTESLMNSLAAPIFPEQFAASFGVIYQGIQNNQDHSLQIEKEVLNFSQQLVEKQARQIKELQDEVKRYQELYNYFYGEESSSSASASGVQEGVEPGKIR